MKEENKKAKEQNKRTKDEEQGLRAQEQPQTDIRMRRTKAKKNSGGSF